VALGGARVRARRRFTPLDLLGDPGTRSGTFVVLVCSTLALALVGLVMVLSASSVEGLDEEGSSWAFFRKQLLWLTAGGVAAAVVSRVDYRAWRRLATPGLVVSFGLLVLVLVPGVGMRVNGATRWLGWGGLGIQPSELAKLAVLVWIADLLARRADWMDRSEVTVRPVMAVLVTTAALVMAQPNLGTTMVLAAMVFVVLFVAGSPLLPLGGYAGVLGAAGMFLALHEPYRRARVTAFMDAWADPANTGYQTIQSQVGLATGGVAGVGLGESRAKWGFLPYAHTDFIYAIVGEELGLVGALVVLALFLAFAVAGVHTALEAPDRFGTLLAAGITAWIVIQAFVNIGAVTGQLPVTGVPLPMVSYGGSSMMVTMVAVGLLLSVARQIHR
jgi:cell division protein FtsW